MARVTVEDCVLKVPNRFELVMMAGARARDLTKGTAPTVDRDNDKNPVVALREIADETVSLDDLRQQLVRGHQRLVEHERGDGDDEPVGAEHSWVAGADQARVARARDPDAADGVEALDGDDGADDGDDEPFDDADPGAEGADGADPFEEEASGNLAGDEIALEDEGDGFGPVS